MKSFSGVRRRLVKGLTFMLLGTTGCQNWLPAVTAQLRNKEHELMKSPVLRVLPLPNAGPGADP